MQTARARACYLQRYSTLDVKPSLTAFQNVGLEAQNNMLPTAPPICLHFQGKRKN
jgi:hypothetical protein